MKKSIIILLAIALISLHPVYPACNDINSTTSLNCWDAEDNNATAGMIDKWATQGNMTFYSSGNVFINDTTDFPLSYNTSGTGGSYAYCFHGGYFEHDTQPYNNANGFQDKGTVMFWFRPIDDYTSTQVLMEIPNGMPRIWFGYTDYDLYAHNYDGGSINIDGTPMHKAENTWTHVAYMWDSNTGYIQIFVNGTNVTSTLSYAVGGQGDYDGYLFDNYQPPTWKPTFGTHAFDLTELFSGCLDDIKWENITRTAQEISNEYNWGDVNGDSAADTTPPVVSNINCTSCTTDSTPGTAPYETDDTTPTFNFTTDESALCAIADVDKNYSDMVNADSERNCSTTESTQQICTLPSSDALILNETDYVYIGCRDTNGNENLTSSSGALEMSLQDLESLGDDAIEYGIQNSSIAGSSVTIYSDQQIYVRDLSNNQDLGTFDKVAASGDQRWAFNYVTTNDNTSGFTNMFNLTPVLYVLEMQIKSEDEIKDLVSSLINSTKI